MEYSIRSSFKIDVYQNLNETKANCFEGLKGETKLKLPLCIF